MVVATKSERLNLRVSAEHGEVLRRAAEVRGETVTDYVVRHAVEAAEIDLADRRLFIVDDPAWNELQAIMSSQPTLPPAIIKLLSNPSVLEEP
jgi:uncharacterized protein (DUF1778 family)